MEASAYFVGYDLLVETQRLSYNRISRTVLDAGDLGREEQQGEGEFWQALPPDNYYRIQARLIGCSDDMDDASPANIRAVQSVSESVIAANDKILDSLCESLV